MQQDSCIKYLGILIDTNLSWKPQIECIVKKIKRSVGILSKLRHYVNIDILTNLYYSLIHPFLTYGIIIWSNTYSTTLQPLYILQKKAVRIMTFSSFDEHSTPLFRLLAIMKLSDLVTFHIALFMHKFQNKLLPSYFDSFFKVASHPNCDQTDLTPIFVFQTKSKNIVSTGNYGQNSVFFTNCH